MRRRIPTWWGRTVDSRLRVAFVPYDLWVGIYLAPDETYVAPLPMIVFRWEHHR